MRNTQHGIHLLSGTGGPKTRTEITFPCQERWNEETPHPDRSAIPGGRKMDGEEGRESIPRRRSMEQVVFSLPPPGEEAEPKPRAAPCERE